MTANWANWLSFLVLVAVIATSSCQAWYAPGSATGEAEPASTSGLPAMSPEEWRA